MRGIGVASRALDLLIARATEPSRKTFGKYMHEHGTVVADIANARIAIDQCRWLVLSAANQVDAGDAKSALKEISEAKVRSPWFVYGDRLMSDVDRGLHYGSTCY